MTTKFILSKITIISGIAAVYLFYIHPQINIDLSPSKNIASSQKIPPAEDIVNNLQDGHTNANNQVTLEHKLSELAQEDINSFYTLLTEEPEININMLSPFAQKLFELQSTKDSKKKLKIYSEIIAENPLSESIWAKITYDVMLGNITKEEFAELYLSAVDDIVYGENIVATAQLLRGQDNSGIDLTIDLLRKAVEVAPDISFNRQLLKTLYKHKDITK